MVRVNADPPRDTDQARALNGRGADAIEKSDFAAGEELLDQAIDPDVGQAHNSFGVINYNQPKLAPPHSSFCSPPR